MRYGISLTHHPLARARRDEAAPGGPAGASAAARDRLVALARAAEEGGASTIWVSEDPDGWDAFAILTMLATATDRIGLATGVTSPLMRHPNLIAASVATLDLVSDGRAILGIGRGEPDWYRNGLGQTIPSPLDALATTIDLVRRWWEPPFRVVRPDAHPGDPFPVRDWERTITPDPGRATPPRIIVAAAGPRALALAGRVADGVLFNDLASDTFLREAVALVRDSAREAGRNPDHLTFTYNSPVLITDDPEPELRSRQVIAALVNALPGMERQMRGAGVEIAPIVAAVRERLDSAAIQAAGGGFPAIRRSGNVGAAADLVPIELIRRLAIVGDRDHVARRLRSLADVGIDEVMVRTPSSGDPADELTRRIRTLRDLI